MATKKEQVAKLRLTVKRDGERWYVLSKKRAREGQEKHGKLEMLGGHLNPGEGSFDAMVRELREEVSSNLLSGKVQEKDLERVLDAGGACHYLYHLEITQEEFASLEPSPKESLGFELVRAVELEAGELHPRLTPRTRKIFDALAKSEKKG